MQRATRQAFVPPALSQKESPASRRDAGPVSREGRKFQLGGASGTATSQRARSCAQRALLAVARVVVFFVVLFVDGVELKLLEPDLGLGLEGSLLEVVDGETDLEARSYLLALEFLHRSIVPRRM